MIVIDVIDLQTRSNNELFDVTLLSRPDLAWSFVDKKGHRHFWAHKDGHETAVGERYDARRTYTLPTLKKVHDGWDYWGDGERTERWHWRCKRRGCTEVIRPGYKSDDNRQYVEGLHHPPTFVARVPMTDSLVRLVLQNEPCSLRVSDWLIRAHVRGVRPLPDGDNLCEIDGYLDLDHGVEGHEI